MSTGLAWKRGAAVLVLAGGLGAGCAWAQQGSIPDAPAPQQTTPDLRDQVNNGLGGNAPGSQGPQQPKPAAGPAGQESSSQDQSLAPAGSTPQQEQAPEIISGSPDKIATIHVPVNEVEVPVTVRDKKGKLVPGLDWRVFRVYEDGVRQHMTHFSSDPYPMSVAFVVDQSLPADVMNKVNEALSAVTGAFTPWDSVAIFAYNSSPREITEFTGAQGPRLNVALQAAKAPGREMGVVAPGGPLDDGPTINGKSIDPNLAPEHGNNIGFSRLPREYHPLNDAILAAATELAKQPKGRRRVIYIISDGKESGSKASYKEVVQFLLTNNISLYGTMVGDSAIWGMGYLDKKHIPLLPTMRDNLLPKYSIATGGQLESQLSENGIQRSFAELTAAVRAQYTLFYNSHAGIMARRFHTIEVRVEGVPDLEITARDGYYPSSTELNR